MTLSAKQLAQSTRRRERLIEICQTLPEVTHEIAGKEHIAFRVRKKTFATISSIITATGRSLSAASRASASNVDW
jgi:hypothetical protein